MIDLEKLSVSLANGIAKIFPAYTDIVLNNAGGEIRRRIFNEGGATKGKIGNYKPKSKVLREQKGYQTAYVDLEQTGTLRRSIQVGVAANDKVLGIAEINYPNGWSTDKNSRQQERNFKKEIFTISDKETERALDGADSWLDKELDIVINEIIKDA